MPEPVLHCRTVAGVIKPPQSKPKIKIPNTLHKGDGSPMVAETCISISKKRANFNCCNERFQFSEEVPKNVDLPPTAVFKTCTGFYNLAQAYTFKIQQIWLYTTYN